MRKIILTAVSIMFIMINNKTFGQYQNNLPVMNFNQLEPYLNFHNDTTYIINFWASWCIPCRKELPAFEQINKEFGGQEVKVLLVSLDFPNQIETVLRPFLSKNKITSQVFVLNDPQSNNWIDKVDKSWSGSIPATIIYNNTSRNFYEKEFDEESLKNLVMITIKHNEK